MRVPLYKNKTHERMVMRKSESVRQAMRNAFENPVVLENVQEK